MENMDTRQIPLWCLLENALNPLWVVLIFWRRTDKFLLVGYSYAIWYVILAREKKLWKTFSFNPKTIYRSSSCAGCFATSISRKYSKSLSTTYTLRNRFIYIISCPSNLHMCVYGFRLVWLYTIYITNPKTFITISWKEFLLILVVNVCWL